MSSGCPAHAVDALRFERLVEEAAREPADRRRGERRGQRRARALARGTALRRRRRALRRPRDRPARGASSARDRAGDRRRARRRAPRRGDRPARGVDRGGALARAPSRAADAGPLSRRAPVRGARGLPRRPRDADRADRSRARARATGPAAGDPRPGSVTRRACADRRSCPHQLEGGSPLLAGRERELRWLRRRWDEARRGAGRLRDGLGIAGDRQDAARCRARATRPSARAAAVLYAGGGEPPEAALATARRPARASDARPCWCSTTPTTRHRRCSRPPLSSPASPRAARSWSASFTTTSRARPPSLACSRAAPPSACGSTARMQDATAEIAALYAPARGRRRSRSERWSPRARACRFGSTGRPASGLGREAADRLAATAGKAADDRTGLRAPRRPSSRAASSICRLAGERTRLYAAEEPPDPSELEVCPFRGLAPFDAAHAEYFFGRERLVAELVARLVGSTLLAVVGPSGSGKSSAVRAGLLPALAERGGSRLGAAGARR